MREQDVKKFLRSRRAPPALIDFAISFYANLSWQELKAVELCGRKKMTQEMAAETSGYSVDAMQKWYRSAIGRLCDAWDGCEWIRIIIDAEQDY